MTDEPHVIRVESLRLYPPDIEWVALCRRTNEPKLKYIEHWLDNLGIHHRRNGKSAHAPILEVPVELHDFCYEQILMANDDRFGIFDERPDDDPLFDAFKPKENE